MVQTVRIAAEQFDGFPKILGVTTHDNLAAPSSPWLVEDGTGVRFAAADWREPAVNSTSVAQGEVDLKDLAQVKVESGFITFDTIPNDWYWFCKNGFIQANEDDVPAAKYNLYLSISAASADRIADRGSRTGSRRRLRDRRPYEEYERGTSQAGSQPTSNS